MAFHAFHTLSFPLLVFWDDQFAFFAGTHRAIRYDMRGAGQSETTPTTEPFHHHEDLRELLKALKIDRVSLIGLSNYAVALDFTIAHPELVEKLVLVFPGLRGYDFRDPWVGHIRRAFRTSTSYASKNQVCLYDASLGQAGSK